MYTHQVKKPSTLFSTLAGWRRVAIWLGVVVVVLLAGRLAPTTSVPNTYASTVPPTPEMLTILVGPIENMGPTGWTVAGIPIQLGDSTRLNERQATVELNNWARVEGYPDGSGGLIAYRIKVLPQQPAVRLIGPLQALEETLVTVSGIDLARTVTTLITGDPVVGDRVQVAAALQTDDTLLALQIHKVGAPSDDDDDDDDETASVELTGRVIDRPDGDVLGDWSISGIPVTVNDQTEVKQHVSRLMPGAWVKVKGTPTGDGGIVATELKATDSRRYHKLRGVLDSLSADEVVVSGIVLALEGNVKLEDNPTVGQPVEVKARYSSEDEQLYVYLITGDDEDDHQGHHTRRIVGEVKQLPQDGLIGDWKIDSRTVVVTASTLIDEHKGLVEEGAKVRAEVFREDDGSLVAVKVVVLREAEHDDDDDDHHHIRYVDFEGEIQNMPENGLRGIWQVDDRTVIVTGMTRIKGDRDDYEVGVAVEVEGYLVDGDKVIARKIELED